MSLKEYLAAPLASIPLLQSITSKSQCISIPENGKRVLVAGTIVLGARGLWKLLRDLSMSGNSENTLIKNAHLLLKRYFNCGNMIWGEFYTRRSWQYLWMDKTRSVIVNYGSYGCVPKQVLQHQIGLQIEFECCPDIYYRRTLLDKYEESRKLVAKFVKCNDENLVFVENITDGINCTLRCILKDLNEEDVVLHTSLTYTMVLKALDVYKKQYKYQTLQFDIDFPISSEDSLCEAYETMIRENPKIKVAIFDHISSASAVVHPIKRFAEICKKHGVMTIVDGAHAPGQLRLDVESYGVDIYLGNLHKWYYAPKSVAIMYINPKYHDKMHPSLVSHNCYQDLQSRFRRQGTKYYSAQSTAGFACEYMESIGGIDHLHSYIPPLMDWAVNLYTSEWGTKEVDTPQSMKAPYMRVVQLPQIFTDVYGPAQEDADRFIVDMIDNHNICIFINPVQGRLCTRVSGQIFSTKREYIYVVRVIKSMAFDMEKSWNVERKMK